MAGPRESQALCVLPTSDLHADISFFTGSVGFELVAIWPSAEPHSAELHGHGLHLLIDRRHRADPPVIVINTDEPPPETLTSPGGAVIRWQAYREQAPQLIEKPCMEVCSLRSSEWTRGRAGTQTRDLLPSRLRGAMVATHIRIPNGGPVDDRVHYHNAGFQLVFCVRGWIKLAYEDQGDPITLHPGDCVAQPPKIRHKVIETSNGLEVIEISVPAEHVTTIDNELKLPSSKVNTHRLFEGQRFCHHQVASGKWQPHRLPGFASCDTGVSAASAAKAGVKLLRAASKLPAYKAVHDADVLFSYVLAGSVRVNRQLMVAGDAFVVPPKDEITLADWSDDLHVLEVSLPGTFRTYL